MRRYHTVIALPILLATLALGWYVALSSSATHEGRPVLIGLAILATAGAAIAIAASIAGRHFVAAAGLMVAAVSPTGFGYLANLLTLGVMVFEVVLGIRKLRAVRT